MSTPSFDNAIQLNVERLCKDLRDKVLEDLRPALPKIIPSIDIELKDCDKQLHELGTAKTTLLQQQVHLDKMSCQFQQLVGQAVRGQYSNRDFFTPETFPSDPRRLRTSLQNLNEQFAKEIFGKGHRRDIFVGHDGLPIPLPRGYSYKTVDKSIIDDPESVTYDGYLAVVLGLLNKSRGTELPGVADSHVVEELFRDQSQKWYRIAEKHLDKVVKLVEDAVYSMITYTTDTRVATRVFYHYIKPKLDKKGLKLTKMLKQLMAPYQDHHPITYNYEYSKFVANMERRNKQAVSEGRINSPITTDSLHRRASELLNSMEAFYAIAVRTFVDNVAVLAVEMVMISKLDKIFAPSDVTFMEPTTIQNLVSELQCDRQKRIELTERRQKLEEVLILCKRHAASTPLGTFTHSPSDSRVEKVRTYSMQTSR